MDANVKLYLVKLGIIPELQNILTQLKSAQERWCADEVDDAEEMWIEYPEFIENTIPKLEKILEDLQNEN